MPLWLSQRCCWQALTVSEPDRSGQTLEKDIYDLSPEELKGRSNSAGSLDESLRALETDHDFLLKGDVFSPQLIERWITYKRDKEITPLRMRPHPLEFSLYFDI